MIEANDSAIIQLISYQVYQTIISIQQLNPELLNEKYRNFPWRDRQFDFLNQLTAELSKVADRDALILKVIKILQFFLIPSFFLSSEFINLTVKICQITQKEAEIKSNALENTEAIAILLLDTENLQLDVEAENFLATVCTYPIKVKIAFANWRNLGKVDAELHQRDYDLIHVPAGKNNADKKMIAVGSSIREHYPKAREVLVCSSDKIMTKLCNHLLKDGLIVYRVCRQQGKITISKIQTGKVELNQLNLAKNQDSVEETAHVKTQLTAAESNSSDLPAEVKNPDRQRIPVINSRAELEQAIAKIVIALTAQSSSCYIDISRVGSEFYKQYGQTVKEILHHLQLKSKFLKFFQSCSALDLKQIGTVYQVAVREVVDAGFIDLPSVPDINSGAILEQVLVKILNYLNIKCSENYITSETLGSEFYKHYGITITAIMKHLKLDGNLTQFLQSCSSFKLEKSETGYRVAIASL